MLRSVVLALGLAAMGASTLGSCTTGPGRDDVAIQRLETALCEKQVECGCSRFTEQACGDWPIYPYGQMELQRSERTYDPECQEQWLAWLDTLTCSTLAAVPDRSELCPLYHGTIREGMECTVEGSLFETDCERGLICAGRVCRDPQGISFGELGEPCRNFDLCYGGGRCVDGLCQRLPGPGEPCLSFECASGAFCAEDVCQPAPLVGEPCMFDECVEGAYCEIDPMTSEGQCRRLGDIGDACSGHSQCMSGNCPAGTCQYPAKPGDPCSNRLPCGPGSICSDGICEMFEVEGDGEDVPVSSVCTVFDLVFSSWLDR